MSVRLDSVDGKISDSISNGTFAALIACARSFGDPVHAWSGLHDPDKWSPDECRLIAARAKQLGALAPLFEELAQDGGVEIG